MFFQRLLTLALLATAANADSLSWTLGTVLPAGEYRLEPFSDPAGVSVATAVNGDGIIVGDVSPLWGGPPVYGVIWAPTEDFQGDVYPEFVFPPYADGDSGTQALDITDSGLVLFSYDLSNSGRPGGYDIYDMNTGTWSLPGDSPADLGWDHTPSLTNDKGWKIEYGTIYDLPEVGHPVIGDQAFLVETPEPGGLWLILPLAMLLVVALNRSSVKGRAPSEEEIAANKAAEEEWNQMGGI